MIISCHFQSLITFVNKHLNKLNLEVTELESQVSHSAYLLNFYVQTKIFTVV